jgi:Tfp pilus assembly protein PilO
MMSLLDLELLLRRPSTLLWVALGLAAVAVAVHVFAIVPLQDRIDERARESARAARLARSAHILQPQQKTLLEQRFDAFRAMLREKRDLTAMLATVFEQATKHGLVLAQAEYKLEHNNAGGFAVYQMRLPVRGAYPRLRGFVDATLAEIACAALEDVDFKRDAISATEAEARLRFLFFLKDGDSRP